LRPEDVGGGTFTISNLGMYDVDAFTAIIVPPQAAILAVGAVVDRVVAVDGKAVVRPMMTVTLSCDHRVVDGARAAEFLRDLVTALHQAEP
jgi:pyruvate dehydrogenase E2 component (dihydrolipoamide acetyltransferase)